MAGVPGQGKRSSLSMSNVGLVCLSPNKYTMQRIEFIQNLSDKDGRPIDPAVVGMPPDFPQDIRTVVTFKAVGEKTELTITEYALPSPDTQMGKNAELGLNQCMDKMVHIFA